MSILNPLELLSRKFILAKSHTIVLYHLKMPESLRCCIMGSPSNTGWGLRGIRSARSEPQRAWEYFLLDSHVLETPTRGTGICLETTSTSPVELGVEKGMSKRAMPSPELKPQRRGRPRKNMKRKGGRSPPS
jgi:hypothetical protein